MAGSKAPKHDFAPAWLKIPEQESGVSLEVEQIFDPSLILP